MGVSEPPGGDAGLTALREELLRRDDAFERERGEKSSRAHIAADAEWEALYQSLKRAEKALAEASRVSGQCAQYIARRRRFCASRAADGCDGYCSLHAVGLGKALSRPAAGTTALQTADASERTAAAADASESVPPRKKTNVHRRMKKLTNPMALHHRTAASSPVWSDVYDDLDRPLLIDVGCAKGRFLMRAATTDAQRFEASLSTFGETRSKRHNLLGLEIYAPIVEEALRWTATNARRVQQQRRDDASDIDRDRDDDRIKGNAVSETTRRSGSFYKNLHFVACNANVTLTNEWLGPVLANKLSYVTILFPDPWSRARHASRRVVTPEFVKTLAEVCKEGTRVYCCSDVKPLAIEMQLTFLSGAEGCKYFVLDEASYAKHGEATERELEESCARAETRAKELLPSGRETREEGERSASGKSEGKEKEKGGFNHVFPAHRYEWQNAEVRNDEAEGENDEQGHSGIDPDLRGDPETDARWLAANPMGVPTERDLVCESKWRPVYRFVVVRRAA